MLTEWQGIPIPQLEGFTGFVPPEGDGTYRVALVGEAPGEQEAKYGRPFYEQAPAGSVLRRLLSRAGLDRGKFVISNTVWSRPPGNYLDGARYEGPAIAAYQPLRDRLADQFNPRVYVALGGVALRTLSHYGGKGASITSVQGYTLDGPYDGTWTIGALHPSAILRGEQRMSGCVIWALQRAIDIARNGFVRLPTRYVTHPGLDDALEFESNYNADTHVLSYDIETLESSALDEEQVEEKDEDISFTITRISLCYDAMGYAISLPWQPPYIDVARRMLSSSGPKRVWNGNFDNPRLAAASCPVLGRIYDSMWAWKFLQPTLPRSLGFVAPFYNWTGEPWKNTSDSEPEAYSCKDAHALQLIADGVDAHLKQKGQWHVYERHVVQLGEVLTRMSANGLPYDRAKAAAFQSELQQKWDERFRELQSRVSDDLKPSKQKTGYVKVPKDLSGLTQREFPVLNKETMEITREVRWCKLEPFLPTSWQQLLALIKHYGHKAGVNRKTKNETTDDETIRKLLKKCRASKKPRDQEFAEILQMCRECRQLSKVQGTYVKGWRPGSDGRVHATPGFWGRMFRISWRRPNISATIQDKQEEYIAQGFRKCVATSPGKLLIECVSPNSKILRSDLTWVKADLISVGDELIGFSEVNGHNSKYLPSVVQSVNYLERPCVRVRTTVGDCVVAENHLFVARFKSYKRRWIAAKDLMGRLGTGAWLTFFGSPWEVDRSWESGYLAGFADGEGSVKGTEWQVAQNAGPTLDYVLDLLKTRSFIPCRKRVAKVSESSFSRHSTKPYTVQQCSFTGMYETMRFLGSMRPQRLMQKANQVWNGRQTWGKRSKPVRVLSVEPLGNGPVIAIKTSTGNYLSDGYFSHNCDWKGIEAVLVGWYANDPEYMRLARLGVHDYMGIYMAGGSVDLSLQDGQLRELFGTFKREHPKLRDDAKHTVHGTNYGMGPFLMAEQYELTVKRAKELQGLYFELFPKVRTWQKSVLDRASRECKLRNPFGYEMPFWEVYRWDSKRQDWALGEDAKSAIAFLPRDTAAAMLKEVLLRLRWLADEGIMLASTHDSITCEVREGDLYRVARILKAEMEKGVPELNQLQIGVELKAGLSWHEDSMSTLDLSVTQEAIPHEVPDSSSLSLPA